MPWSMSVSPCESVIVANPYRRMPSNGLQSTGLCRILAETVRLAWLHELPYAEIAQVTDVPVGTVKSRVSRARALMQETLGGRL